MYRITLQVQRDNERPKSKSWRAEGPPRLFVSRLLDIVVSDALYEMLEVDREESMNVLDVNVRHLVPAPRWQQEQWAEETEEREEADDDGVGLVDAVVTDDVKNLIWKTSMLTLQQRLLAAQQIDRDIMADLASDLE